MTIGAKPPADITVDPSLIRALLQEQATGFAHLPLIDIGEGWDNRLFRLGDDFAVRVPRRAVSAVLIEHEQQWLPRLARQLPLPIPVPVHVGRPGCGFPWSWSVVRWLPGQSALHTPPENPSSAAVALGRFLHALHQAAPDNAPHSPWRGGPLTTRTEKLTEHLDQLDGLVDRVAILDFWERALSTPPWPGPPLWIHGDLHPGNLLVSDGHLSGVIDFGDLTAGDPATDVSVVWMLLPQSARSSVRAAARGAFDSLDDDTWMRARAWALALGLSYLAASRDDDAMGALGRATIDAALDDGP